MQEILSSSIKRTNFVEFIGLFLSSRLFKERIRNKILKCVYFVTDIEFDEEDNEGEYGGGEAY